ncbi:MAG: serine acetyltransferase [Alloprevotella sp.]|nr:serine acetyltransferase [Alloprevotella sp.]
MRKDFAADMWRYEGERSKHWLVRLKYRLFVPSAVYIRLLRNVQGAGSFLSRYYWMALLKLTQIITGIQIPPQTRIGRGLYIGHWGTIVVNPDAHIGVNFSIAPGCVVGNAVGKRRGAPTMGDNVYMCANSVVVGGVTIGNDVLFAPGAFCNFDVPSNALVIGNPGVIHMRSKSPTAPYITYPIPDEASYGIHPGL